MADRIRARREEIDNKLNTTVSNALMLKVREKISQIRIDDALEWYWEKLMNQVKDAEQKFNLGIRTDREALRVRFSYIFGEDRAEALITNTSIFNSWCDEATKALLVRMTTLTTPFVSADESKVAKNLEGDTESLKLMKIQGVFIPRNFKYTKATQG